MKIEFDKEGFKCLFLQFLGILGGVVGVAFILVLASGIVFLISLLLSFFTQVTQVPVISFVVGLVLFLLMVTVAINVRIRR